MKHVKKLASILLALVMVLSMSVTAFAEGGDNPSDPAASTGNTITVEDAEGGETYSIYKMLDLVVNDDKTAFSYTVNSAWSGFFGTDGDGAAYVTIDEQGYVTWKDGMDTAENMIAFGKAAAKYAADSTLSSNPTAQTPSADDDITFSGLEAGYYLITSTNGTKVIVDTTPTNPNPSIKEKNENPSITKQVQEDSKVNATGNGWGATNDAEIGQNVNFKTVVSAKSGAKSYVVHDKMSVGLNFNDKSVVITAGTAETLLTAKGEGDASTPYSTSNLNGYQYEVVTTNLDSDCDFHIVFVQAYLDTITADTDITITYSATLTKDAVIASTGNTNDTKLDWGNANHTEWVGTKTYTWESDVLKYGNNNESNVLDGAQFVLLNSGETKVAKFDANGKITEWVDVPNAVDGKITWPTEAIQTTNDDGKIYIKGLDSDDTYLLREVKAPEGYNLLKDDQEIKITANEDTTTQTMTQTALTTKVNNESGNELPSTGGMGTTIFYVVGSILLIGAAVLLITRKRMNAKK